MDDKLSMLLKLDFIILKIPILLFLLIFDSLISDYRYLLKSSMILIVSATMNHDLGMLMIIVKMILELQLFMGTI